MENLLEFDQENWVICAFGSAPDIRGSRAMEASPPPLSLALLCLFLSELTTSTLIVDDNPSPTIHVASSPNNEIYKMLAAARRTRSLAGCSVVRWAHANESFSTLKENDALLVLSDASLYPSSLTSFQSEWYGSVKQKNASIFIEFPEALPTSFGAATQVSEIDYRHRLVRFASIAPIQNIQIDLTHNAARLQISEMGEF